VPTSPPAGVGGSDLVLRPGGPGLDLTLADRDDEAEGDIDWGRRTKRRVGGPGPGRKRLRLLDALGRLLLLGLTRRCCAR